MSCLRAYTIIKPRKMKVKANFPDYSFDLQHKMSSKIHNCFEPSKVLISSILLLLIWVIVNGENLYAPGKTRSLTGGMATTGSNETIGTVLLLMKVGILEGYAIRRIKMFNDRVYLSRYRRSYWFGTRYYALDNYYFLETRETCAYRMKEEERKDIEYEENPEESILDIVYQCQRHAQYCCGLDCCDYY